MCWQHYAVVLCCLPVTNMLYPVQHMCGMPPSSPGYNMAMPLLVAPMAMHGLAHPVKELGTARAAAAMNIPMVRRPAVKATVQSPSTTRVLHGAQGAAALARAAHLRSGSLRCHEKRLATLPYGSCSQCMFFYFAT